MQRRHWSRLSHIILDVLLISAMSNESERVFSEAHHIISWKRAQIKIETLKYVKYLKHWKKHDILKK